MWKAGLLTIVTAASLIMPQNNQEDILNTEMPQEVQAACEKYGEMYDISPQLLEAICYNESRYVPDVENDGCKGVMQINEPVHKKRLKKLGVSDIYDIDSNVHVGADILADLFDMYTDEGAVLAAYHGERGGVSKARRGILSTYTVTILENTKKLEGEQAE